MGERDDRDRRRAALQGYNRRESAAAMRAESSWEGSGLYADHAFLARWGAVAELDARLRELGRILEWWARRGPFVQPADLEAIKALEVARDRLADILRSAESVEQRVRERGWEFDPETRTLKEVKGRDLKAGGARGPRRSLISFAIHDAFMLVVQQGSPKRNTRAVRDEIRSRLAETFHPDVLTDQRIRSAVNAILNPDRHY